MGSYNLKSNLTMVDLPNPLFPTKAIVLPYSNLKLRPLSILTSGVVG